MTLDDDALPASRTRIKICGLTREQDVDAAVAAGVDAIGFVRYPKSARLVSIDRAVALARRLPPFVTPVLLYVNADPQQVLAESARLAPLLVQFHGDETPQQCLPIQAFSASLARSV
jgi:phosphoribosylanthranilate isomerase